VGGSIPASVRDVLARFAARVRQDHGAAVLNLRLFGSYARGEAGEGSDIDVLVLLEEVDFARKKQILDVAGDLWLDTGLLISPVVMGADLYRTWHRQERGLVMAIEQEGAPL
jgi:uncharacterized protein